MQHEGVVWKAGSRAAENRMGLRGDSPRRRQAASVEGEAVVGVFEGEGPRRRSRSSKGGKGDMDSFVAGSDGRRELRYLLLDKAGGRRR